MPQGTGYRNRTNTCDICKENFKLSGHGTAYREYNKDGNWTGEWICHKCYMKERNILPDSHNNLLKSVGDRRTGNQDPNSSNAKGDLFEELTCRWRGVKNLNIENDSYSYKTPIDHSKDSELGILQTKGSSYNNIYRQWHFGFKHGEIQKLYDNLIGYCANKYRIIIERIYVFPKLEIINRTSINVKKNPTDRWGNSITPWYEKYRIIDEDILIRVNNIWKEITKK